MKRYEKRGIQIYFESNCQKRDIPSLIREVEVTSCEFFLPKKLMSKKTTKKQTLAFHPINIAANFSRLEKYFFNSFLISFPYEMDENVINSINLQP